MKKAIIIDIDGTLTDTRHRLWMLRGDGPIDWDAFFEAGGEDPPFPAIVELTRVFYARRAEWLVMLCTGRPESNREITEEWLQRYDVPYDFLVMRPNDERRPDSEVKPEMAQRICKHVDAEIMLALDDRPSMVDQWRKLGITCLAMDGSEWVKPHAGHFDGAES